MKRALFALLPLVATACSHEPTNAHATARVLQTLPLFVGQSAQVSPNGVGYDSVPAVSSSAVAFVAMRYWTALPPEGPGRTTQVFDFQAMAPGEAVVTIRNADGTPAVQDTFTVQATAPHGAFAQVSAGFGPTTCAVSTRGAGYCWGALPSHLGVANTFGDNANSFDNIPLAVAGGLTFAAISVGEEHSCGLTTDGAAYCWGTNGYGKFGNGTTSATPTSAPEAVTGGLTFTAVSASIGHTCGVTTNGAIYCWGANNAGQLGIGDQTYPMVTPTAVSGGLTFVAVSAGQLYSCGLTTSGAAYCWGDNEYGQLGTGNSTSSYAPAPVSGGLSFVGLSAGLFHACGLTRDGAAYCWGGNFSGELGIGSANGPQQCTAGYYSFSCSTTPVAVSGDLAFASISAGDWTTCGVTTAGAAYCWGDNGYGQLGTSTNALTPYPNPSPVPVSGGLTFKSISAGYLHTCGVTTAGATYCWGDNAVGELGDGSTTIRATPVMVLGP